MINSSKLGMKEMVMITLTLLLSNAFWRASMSAGLITVIWAQTVSQSKQNMINICIQHKSQSVFPTFPLVDNDIV